MEESKVNQFLVESLLNKGLATQEQMHDCVENKGSSGKPLSELLLEKGFATRSQLLLLLKEYGKQQEDSEPDVAQEIAFGVDAVEEGHTTSAEVWKALEERGKGLSEGPEQGLPQFLAGRGTLNLEQVRDILEGQGRAILRCESCQSQYNVDNYSLKKNYTCLNCGGALFLPEKLSTASVEGTVMDDDAEKGKIDDMFIGKEIQGCEILERLGEGGMGAVYKGRDLALNRLVAVKIQSLALVGDLHRKMFLREARAAAQLEHPNVVQVYATGEHAGCHFIIMQYVDGEDLNSKIQREEAIPQQEALEIILDAASGLSAAHGRGMVHRDIKPANIMITKEGQVKVADFGLVKSLEIEKDISGFSRSMLMGTPHYMAPEQFDGKFDARTDIYALGITFYFLLTGKIPFSGTTPFQIRDAHVSGDYPDIQEAVPDVSPAVAKILRKMMAKDPADRHANADELVRDLGQVKTSLAAGEGADEDIVLISDAGLEEKMAAAPARKWPLGPRSRIIIPVVGAIVLVVIILALTMSWGPSVSPEEEAEALFTQLKVDVDRLLGQEKFYECLQVLGRFPEKFSRTPTQKDVDAERTRVAQAAIGVFERLLGQIEQLRREGKFEEAAAADDRILTRLGKIEKDIHSLPKAIKKVTRIVKKASDAEKRNSEALEKWRKFTEVKNQAEVLITEGKLDEAEQLMVPYAQDSIALIRTRANEVLSTVAKRRRALAEAALKREELERQRADFEEAKALAATDRQIKQFDAAREKIAPFANSEVEDIRTEAQRLLAEIAEEEEAYQKLLASQKFSERVDGELGFAEEALGAGYYARARDFAEKYVNDERLNGSQRTRAMKITETAKLHLNFEEEMQQIVKLVSAGKLDQAKKVLRKWRESPQEKIATRAAQKYTEVLYVAEPDMTYLLPGSFTVGSADTKDKNPQRTIEVGGFYVDKYEVTNEEYARFVQATKAPPPPHWPGGQITHGQEKYPVTWVTHAHAAAYARWAGKRLPTEEEWEIAAGLSNGKIQTYPWGGQFFKDACNINSRGSKPVGSFSTDKSPLGAFDMAGNVCEWTDSKSSDGRRYAVRGGDWGSRSSAAARTTYRFLARPEMASARLGFRCAKDAK